MYLKSNVFRSDYRRKYVTNAEKQLIGQSFSKFMDFS